MLMMLATMNAAHALSCLEGANQTLPVDGATDVPVDVQVRVEMFGWEEALELKDADGNPVALDHTVTENPLDEQLHYLAPQEPLAADAVYTVHGQDDRLLATFTTTSQAQDELDTPVLLDAYSDKGRDEWGSWDHLRVELEAQGPASYVVRVASNQDMSDAREVEVMGWEDQDSMALSVGSGLCSGSIALDGDRWVSVATIGYDGEPSEFSAPTQARLTGGGGGGCSTSPLGAGLLVGLASLLVSRRRGQR